MGCTSQGGKYGSGLIYAFDIVNETMTTLAAFDGAGGSTPQASPIQVGDTIYGIAGQAGAYGYGVVWSMELGGNSTSITVLHNFEGGKEDTATPFGPLTYNPSDNKLYGMAFTAVSQGTLHDLTATARFDLLVCRGLFMGAPLERWAGWSELLAVG